MEVFQATGNLRKVFIDGTVSRSVDSEIGNGERVVLFWILIPGLIIILTAVVALIGICYRWVGGNAGCFQDLIRIEVSCLNLQAARGVLQVCEVPQ